MSKEISTKTRILESAYNLFIEQGYHGCSMRDIARATRIQVGSIYNHFENKERIFESVFFEKHPLFRILEILDNVDGNDVKTLITNAIDELSSQMLTEPGLLNLLFIELVEMKAKHIHGRIDTTFPISSQFVETIYDQTSQIRDIRKPVLLRSLIGFTLSYVLFTWFMGTSDSKKWGSLDELTDVYLKGILR